MRRTKPIKELYKIIEMPREIDRYHALQDWINGWLEEVQADQRVTSRKYLTSEFEDALKLKLVETIALDLSEAAVRYKLDEKNINAKMLVVRRKKNE